MVKQRKTVKLGGRLEAEALRILREIPGLEVEAEPGGPDRGLDAFLTFGGEKARVAVEVKARANAAAAWQLVQLAQARPETPFLLIANETTEEARRILDEHDIGVVDGLGNAHIELPGLLVHLKGQRQQQRRGGADEAGTPRPTRLAGKAGVAAQALLLHRERDWRVSALADEANISVGLAHRVVARLEAEGVVTGKGKGRNRIRRLADPPALLDLWIEENDDRITRTLGYRLAQTPRQLVGKLAQALGDRAVTYAITGAAGASLVAPFVTAVPVVDVWVPERAGDNELYEAAGAEPVTEGHNVVFLQAKGDTGLAFREKKKDVWLANIFRLYADLRRDPRRGREQAEHLRREVIGV
jgi:hypothetical protein